MKKTLLTILSILLIGTAFAQNSLFIGVSGGINGCFYQFNNAAFSRPVTGGLSTFQAKLTSTGPSIPARAELIYGTAKFRLGYQFEYERIMNSSYAYRSTTSSVGFSDTIISDMSIKQHFFCHNLLLSYLIYDNDHNLRLLPSLTVGYFHGITDATIAPFDYSQLNKNRFKIGISLDMEYYMKQLAIVVSPTYGLVPIKSFTDPNQKGYMHFVGLSVGLRFNVLHDDSSPSKKKKTPKKEKPNPEDDNDN